MWQYTYTLLTCECATVTHEFSSGRVSSPLQSKGTGQRLGLQLVVNINQSDYATAFDAGVKVAIHKQSEPPLVHDEGIAAVPTGSNAHVIGIKKQRIQDQTRQNCTFPEDLSNLNFLEGANTIHTRSQLALWIVSTLYVWLTTACECIGTRSFYSPDELLTASSFPTVHCRKPVVFIMSFSFPVNVTVLLLVHQFLMTRQRPTLINFPGVYLFPLVASVTAGADTGLLRGEGILQYCAQCACANY